MSADLIIDSLVDAIGLAGALALIAALRRRDSDAAMRWRWTLALGLVSAMYLCRGVYWLSGVRGFDTATAIAAAGIPLAVLLVVEGLIRRHAPLAAKLIVLAGTVAVVVLIASHGFGRGTVTTAVGMHVGLGLTIGMAVALAGMRGLDAAERRLIAALTACLLILIPAALTDFRDFLPGTPARLSPLAVLFFGWVGLTIGNWRIPQRLGWVMLLGAVSALVGFGLAQAGAGASAVQISVVVLSALMLVTICAEAIARVDGGLALRRALIAAPPGDREALLLALTSSPTVGNGALLSAADLDDPAAVEKLAAEYPVLRLRDAPWGLARDDIAAEGTAALFETHNATHLLTIQHVPLVLLAVNQPALASGEAAEADLALAQRLLALTGGKP
jgi:hypothetical protein